MITAEQLQDDFRYLFPDEVACLKRLTQSLPPNPVVVNIGAGAGTSGLAFMESRPDILLYTIDIQDASSPFGCLAAERDVFKRAGFISRPGFSWCQLCGDSKFFASDWHMHKYPPPSLVFIDGDHEYFACKGDIVGWLPRIKPGGILAVHDFEKEKAYSRANLPAHIPHPMPWVGVDRAVRNYLCGKYEIVEHVDTLIAFRIQ